MDGDDFGFSPDVGCMVVRGTTAYTEHGKVIEGWERTFIRFMSYDGQPADMENYADWTDAHRAEVYAAARAAYERQEEEAEAYRRARQTLVDSAKQKLTEDEWEAVVDWARD